MTPRLDDGGAGTLTVAIVSPAVLLLLMVTVQAGVFWHARQRADAAASRAVAAAAREGGSTAAGENAAAQILAGAPLDNASVTVTLSGDVSEVRVTGTAPALIPGFVWQVQAVAVAPIERFVPETERQ